MDCGAPAHDPGASALGFWRRGMAQGLGYSLPGLCFLLIPVVFAWGTPTGTMLLLGAALILTGVFAVGWAWVTAWPEWARWLWLLGLILSISAAGVVVDRPSLPAYFSVYVTAVAATLIAWFQARIVILSVAVVAAGLALVDGQPLAVMMAVLALGMGLMIGSSFETARKDRLLADEQRRTAVLAVAAERERIGRDLHDILGHSLTTIAVRADLAGRLVGRDDDAVRAEIAQLAAIARHSLADVRATASGLQQVRLSHEIASARSVLTASGIEAVTPSAPPHLSDERAELFGYVVREAVTNVVRHAGAATCTIECDEHHVTVRDDGRGIHDGARGSGLAGLRARVTRCGATLEVTSSPSGTVITARMETP